jgi:hypothetical protein
VGARARISPIFDSTATPTLTACITTSATREPSSHRGRDIRDARKGSRAESCGRDGVEGEGWREGSGWVRAGAWRPRSCITRAPSISAARHHHQQQQPTCSYTGQLPLSYHQQPPTTHLLLQLLHRQLPLSYRVRGRPHSARDANQLRELSVSCSVGRVPRAGGTVDVVLAQHLQGMRESMGLILTPARLVGAVRCRALQRP